ncbi:hypothetical protein ATCC90586_009116 [Pythium insidiosum]|nr:hypothetical protein ATCC90586_009116 [Pythium insidiosum]
MGNTPPRRGSASRELDKFTAPTGLYPSCPWDVRTARRLILDKRLAPRIPGREAKESCFTQECPICFMYYPGNLNQAACCNNAICTECYLQLRPPKLSVCCPFCNRNDFAVKYAAPAVFNLSSVYAESSPAANESRGASPAGVDPAIARHFASVEDRHHLRDSLRAQLNLSDRRLTTPPPRSASMHAGGSGRIVISSPEDVVQLSESRYIIATAADAARLEEMMLLEAIRRSMHDVNLAKDQQTGDDDPDAREETRHEQDDADGEADTLRPARIVVEQHAAQRRPSTNPFDEAGGAPAASAQRRESWNPFSD